MLRRYVADLPTDASSPFCTIFLSLALHSPTTRRITRRTPFFGLPAWHAFDPVIGTEHALRQGFRGLERPVGALH